ncbi:hypothetical protein L0U85_00605 [Glycomyces sp. L485]|uniref:hypothetical protein n=1 Tax=Glycomyces sp. L485 TaxID=2909235 RepID=UPI001F4A7B09|nr:hypothetical protein [Glycomyces sp. L485]MCH7229369.1 hypothetical protein [Glycomyces sp. L485]
MGLNLRWLRALGREGAAPYEFAKHPLGSPASVFADELYSVDLRAVSRSRKMPGRGEGVLVLESDLRGGIVETDADAVRPFAPVVLVDGEPVVTGFGRGHIGLDPGRHLVQVQCGASGAYWPVDIGPGRFTRLTSFVSQRLDEEPPLGFIRQFVLAPARSIPPRLGRRPTKALTAVGGFAGFAAGALAASAAGMSLPDATFLRLLFFLVFLVPATVGAVLGHRLGLLLEKVWNTAAEARLALRLPVGEHRVAPCPGGTWRPVDPRDESTPAVERGTGVLRLAIAYAQAPAPAVEAPGRVYDEEAVRASARRRRQFGEEYPPQVRPWVGAPRVRVDGEAVPAIWGVNEYRLGSGRHRVEVELPPPPEVLVSAETEVDLPARALSREVTLSEAAPVAIEAMAVIEMVPGHDGWELERYAARMR